MHRFYSNALGKVIVLAPLVFFVNIALSENGGTSAQEWIEYKRFYSRRPTLTQQVEYMKKLDPHGETLEQARKNAYPLAHTKEELMQFLSVPQVKKGLLGNEVSDEYPEALRKLVQYDLTYGEFIEVVNSSLRRPEGLSPVIANENERGVPFPSSYEQVENYRNQTEKDSPFYKDKGFAVTVLLQRAFEKGNAKQKEAIATSILKNQTMYSNLLNTPENILVFVKAASKLGESKKESIEQLGNLFDVMDPTEAQKRSFKRLAPTRRSDWKEYPAATKSTIPKDWNAKVKRRAHIHMPGFTDAAFIDYLTRTASSAPDIERLLDDTFRDGKRMGKQWRTNVLHRALSHILTLAGNEALLMELMRGLEGAEYLDAAEKILANSKTAKEYVTRLEIIKEAPRAEHFDSTVKEFRTVSSPEEIVEAFKNSDPQLRKELKEVAFDNLEEVTAYPGEEMEQIETEMKSPSSEFHYPTDNGLKEVMAATLPHFKKMRPGVNQWRSVVESMDALEPKGKSELRKLVPEKTLAKISKCEGFRKAATE